MALAIEPGGWSDVRVIELSGDIDAEQAAQLTVVLEALADDGWSGVVIDLGNADDLSADAVAVLVRARRRGLDVRCDPVSPAARRVLAATGAALVLGVALS
jgi:anti-anti-sigma factor